IPAGGVPQLLLYWQALEQRVFQLLVWLCWDYRYRSLIGYDANVVKYYRRCCMCLYYLRKRKTKKNQRCRLIVKSLTTPLYNADTEVFLNGIQLKYFKIVINYSKIMDSSQNVYKTLYNCIINAIIMHFGATDFAIDYKSTR